MKRMIYIALLKVKLTFKDRTALIAMFVAPIVFVAVIVMGFGGGQNTGEVRYPISIVNADNGHYSDELISMLKEDSTFQITEEDYEKAREHVESGSIPMAIVIPEGFSDFMGDGIKSMEVLKLQDNESTMALLTVVNNYVFQLRISAAAGEVSASTLAAMGKIEDKDTAAVGNRVESEALAYLDSPGIGYEYNEVVPEKKEGLDGISYMAIGLIIMFMMFFVTESAGSVLFERELGTWARILSTPARNWSITGGYILGSFMLGWIQIGVLILASRHVFHVNWGSSPLGLIVLFSTFLLAIIGLGAVLSSIVRSRAQLTVLAPILTVPTCMLAGCFWSREIMSDIMLRISDFVPQTWVLKGMVDLIARGSDISAIYIPSIVLIIFAAVFFTIGSTLLSFQNK